MATGTPSSTVRPPRPPAPIDPRIRARRIEVRRVEGRRRLQRVVDILALTVVAGAFVGALWTPLLDVDELHIEGATRTGIDAVRAHAGIEVGDQLIDVDLRAVGRRLTALPWVGEVTLHRGVDGVVRISVTERTAVAALGTGGAAVLVDRDGRILGPLTERAEAATLIQLSGIDAVPAAGEFLPQGLRGAVRLAERLASGLPGSVASLDPHGLVAQLAAGGEVRFGDVSSLEAKIQSLQTVLDQVDLRCLAVVDLRLPGSPVLTREERCS